jgi:DNA-binding transcriptional ArsR family regulator
MVDLVVLARDNLPPMTLAGPAPPVRDRLLDLVAGQPGINKSDACRHLGVAWGTVSYHVRILAAAGQVTVESVGREASIFPAGTPEARRKALRALLEDDARLVLGILGRVREGSLLDLAVLAQRSRKVVRRHLRALVAAGLVQERGLGRPRYALRADLAPPRPSVALVSALAPALERRVQVA